MKLFSLICTFALLTVALADTAAPMKTVAEKAQAAHQEALALESLLKTKTPDMQAAAVRAEALHQHVAEMHAAAQTLPAGSPEVEKMKAAAAMLNALTEHKAKQIAEAKGKLDRSMLRYSVKNLTGRAEQILKTSRKIGG